MNSPRCFISVVLVIQPASDRYTALSAACAGVWPVKVDLGNKAANEELIAAATLSIISGINTALASNKTWKLITIARDDCERTQASARTRGCHHSSLYTQFFCQVLSFFFNLLTFHLHLPFLFFLSFSLSVNTSSSSLSSHPCIPFISSSLFFPLPHFYPSFSLTLIFLLLICSYFLFHYLIFALFLSHCFTRFCFSSSSSNFSPLSLSVQE